MGFKRCGKPNKKAAGLLLIMTMIAQMLLLNACHQEGAEMLDVDYVFPQADGQLTDHIQHQRNETLAFTFPHQNKKSMVIETRTFTVEPNETAVQAAVQTIIGGPRSNHAISVISDCALLRVEQSSNVVTIWMSRAFSALERLDRYLAKISIVNTLVEIDGVDYVNIYVEGYDISHDGFPDGAMSQFTGDVYAQWLKIEEQYRQLDDKAIQEQVIQRDITLYYQDVSNCYLIAEVHTMRFRVKDLINQIFHMLQKTPDNVEYLRTALPLMYEIVPYGSEYYNHFRENRRLSIYINPLIEQSFDENRFKQKLAHGAVIKSLIGVIPEVDAVKLMVDGKPLNTISDIPSDPYGFLWHQSYYDIVGDFVSAYMPNRQLNRLVPIQRAVSCYEEMNYVRIQAMFAQIAEGPKENDAKDIMHIMPAGVTSADLLGSELQDDLARINLSKNFFIQCQKLSAQEEFILVYTLVNTFTRLSGVNAVQIYQEGHRRMYFSKRIRIDKPLLTNPGLIVF